MTTAKYSLGNLSIVGAPGWLDVTHELNTPDAPFTLSRPDGVGALQFSVASYKSGPLPTVTIQTLRTLLADFAASRELGKGFAFQARETSPLICAASFNLPGQFLRVWYCSNGQDVVLVTYVCEKGLEDQELPECEQIVSNLQFGNAGVPN